MSSALSREQHETQVSYWREVEMLSPSSREQREARQRAEEHERAVRALKIAEFNANQGKPPVPGQ